ncbi:glucosamine-6-phosphate deaminase [Petrocella sp. FN5]|uniref:glucosamine-6-phosphate deaminase n=1 Tax=Petrocella sp. FN5 TaxID=3032002 RepID=UPI0023DBCA9C|nr:glucosamine-6-phosphate deaminase [Petrocella sp. FN5]MDF1617383.1 glucosamine-6-phosphate deaminase [Petrocella sp. FN5]
MSILMTENYEEMSKKAALLVAAQVTLRPDSVLGLATGSTPEGMYKELVAMYEQGEIDFSEVKTFNLDEYYPIEENNPQSYAYYMKKNLFDHININPQEVHIPNGTARDVEASCEVYDKIIEAAGGIDLQVLGIGNNGHIGFNEPDIHFEAGTHLVELDDETIEANARFFTRIEDVPRRAISMGIRTIMHSKKIILLASGASKGKVIKAMLFGEVTPNLPASILLLHNDVTLILDKEAAAYIIKHLEK